MSELGILGVNRKKLEEVIRKINKLNEEDSKFSDTDILRIDINSFVEQKNNAENLLVEANNYLDNIKRSNEHINSLYFITGRKDIKERFETRLKSYEDNIELEYRKAQSDLKNKYISTRLDIIEDKNKEAEKVSAYGCLYLGDIERFIDDKDIVMLAVKKSGNSLAYTSERLKHDKDIVLEAVK